MPPYRSCSHGTDLGLDLVLVLLSLQAFGFWTCFLHCCLAFLFSGFGVALLSAALALAASTHTHIGMLALCGLGSKVRRMVGHFSGIFFTCLSSVNHGLSVRFLSLQVFTSGLVISGSGCSVVVSLLLVVGLLLDSGFFFCGSVLLLGTVWTSFSPLVTRDVAVSCLALGLLVGLLVGYGWMHSSPLVTRDCAASCLALCLPLLCTSSHGSLCSVCSLVSGYALGGDGLLMVSAFAGSPCVLDGLGIDAATVSSWCCLCCVGSVGCNGSSCCCCFFVSVFCVVMPIVGLGIALLDSASCRVMFDVSVATLGVTVLLLLASVGPSGGSGCYFCASTSVMGILASFVGSSCCWCDLILHDTFFVVALVPAVCLCVAMCAF